MCSAVHMDFYNFNIPCEQRSNGRFHLPEKKPRDYVMITDEDPTHGFSVDYTVPCGRNISRQYTSKFYIVTVTLYKNSMSDIRFEARWNVFGELVIYSTFNAHDIRICLPAKHKPQIKFTAFLNDD